MPDLLVGRTFQSVNIGHPTSFDTANYVVTGECPTYFYKVWTSWNLERRKRHYDKILIVEDEPNVLEILSDFLVSEGYELSQPKMESKAKTRL